MKVVYRPLYIYSIPMSRLQMVVLTMAAKRMIHTTRVIIFFFLIFIVAMPPYIMIA
jgi:hypothetical protein